MRFAGNTRAGLWFWPVEPGLLCEIELPWLARLDEKWWRFDHAGETLADRDAPDVHLLADLEDLDADLAADLQAGEVLGLGAEFAQRVARFDSRLGEVSGKSLVDATARRLPNATWTDA